jgi:hypothetical protein
MNMEEGGGIWTLLGIYDMHAVTNGHLKSKKNQEERWAEVGIHPLAIEHLDEVSARFW